MACPTARRRWRCGYPLVCMLAGLALGSCVHPDGHKDLLAFLQDGTTTKKAVETRIGPAVHLARGSHLDLSRRRSNRRVLSI